MLGGCCDAARGRRFISWRHVPTCGCEPCRVAGNGIGDAGVGKTSVLTRFSDGLFVSSTRATVGIDLKKSEKVQKETAENDQNSSMPDLLSQLANSKAKRSAKKSNDKTFDVADDGPAQQRADRAAKYKNAISKEIGRAHV